MAPTDDGATVRASTGPGLSRRRWLAAGAALALVAVAGAGLAVLMNGDGGGTVQLASEPATEADLEAVEETGDTADPDTGDTAEPDTGLSGQPATLARLQVGDCADLGPNPDRFALETFRDCDEPHQFEVIGLVEHPDAGGPYPGEEALFQFGAVECRRAFETRFGLPETETTLQAFVFHPVETEWSDDDLYTFACAVARTDGQLLPEPIGEDLTGWLRQSGDALSLLDIQLAQCFDTATELAEDGVSQRVIFRRCDEPHDGEVYWKVLLDDLQGEAYPAEAVVEETGTRCHDILHDDYGVDHLDFGITSTAVHPSQQEWDDFGARVGACLVVFDEPRFEPLATIVGG